MSEPRKRPWIVGPVPPPDPASERRARRAFEKVDRHIEALIQRLREDRGHV